MCINFWNFLSLLLVSLYIPMPEVHCFNQSNLIVTFIISNHATVRKCICSQLGIPLPRYSANTRASMTYTKASSLNYSNLQHHVFSFIRSFHLHFPEKRGIIRCRVTHISTVTMCAPVPPTSDLTQQRECHSSFPRPGPLPRPWIPFSPVSPTI